MKPLWILSAAVCAPAILAAPALAQDIASLRKRLEAPGLVPGQPPIQKPITTVKDKNTASNPAAPPKTHAGWHKLKHQYLTSHQCNVYYLPATRTWYYWCPSLHSYLPVSYINRYAPLVVPPDIFPIQNQNPGAIPNPGAVPGGAKLSAAQVPTMPRASK